MKIILPVIFSMIAASCFSQQWSWARQGVSTTTTQTVRGIGHDDAGNVYVLGNGMSSASFGNTILPPGGFILKYDAAGTFVWGKNVPTETALMVVDGNGFIYLSGGFYNTLSLGNTTLTSNGNNDIFLLRYNAAGTRLWERSYGGIDLDLCNKLALDTSGDVYLTGSFFDYINFDTLQLQSNLSHPRFYLAKVRKSGDVAWITAGDSMYYAAHYLFVNNNTVFVEGHYKDTVTSWNCSGAFHDRYDLNGMRIYNNKQCLYNYAHTDMIADDSLNIYHVENSSQYGYVNLRKYDASMNFKWARTIGKGYQDYVLTSGMLSDSSGNIYLAGMVGGANCSCDSVQVQPGTPWVKVNGYSDLAVSKFDPNGNLTWIKTAEGKSGEMVSHMVRDRQGNISIAGRFNYHFPGGAQTNGTLTVAHDVLSPDGSWEQIFVARLSSQAVFTGLDSFGNTERAGIFPNPTTGEFTISAPQDAVVTVFDLVGNPIRIEQRGDGHFFNISHLPQGIYFIVMSQDGKKVVEKILKQ